MTNPANVCPADLTPAAAYMAGVTAERQRIKELAQRCAKSASWDHLSASKALDGLADLLDGKS
jgi:hypothetical protein